MGAGQCNNPTKIYKISFRKVAKHRGGHTKIKIVRLKSGQAPIQGTFNISVITVLKLGSQENLAPRDVGVFDTLANLSFISVISCCINGPEAAFQSNGCSTPNNSGLGFPGA